MEDKVGQVTLAGQHVVFAPSYLSFGEAGVDCMGRQPTGSDTLMSAFWYTPDSWNECE